MDKIYIKNYTVVARHGYYKEEHSKPQRFVVSVVAMCDVKSAGEKDDLKETINYEHLRKYIYEVLMQSPRSLVESLAHEISERVLAHSMVVSVEVDIQKPDVWNDCTPGVTITRQR